MSAKKPCSASTCKEKNKNSPANDTSKKWDSVINNSEFMDALLSFMNQSYMAVSEVREHTVLDSTSSPTAEVSMTQEEREAKAKEIIAKLQEKYKELAELEAELGEMSTTVESDSTAMQTAKSHAGDHSLPPLSASSACYQPSFPSPEAAVCEEPCYATGGSRVQFQEYPESPDVLDTAFIESPTRRTPRAPRPPDRIPTQSRSQPAARSSKAVPNQGFIESPQIRLSAKLQYPDMLNQGFRQSPSTPVSPNHLLNTGFVQSSPQYPDVSSTEYTCPESCGNDTMNAAFIGSPRRPTRERRLPTQSADILNGNFIEPQEGAQQYPLKASQPPRATGQHVRSPAVRTGTTRDSPRSNVLNQAFRQPARYRVPYGNGAQVLQSREDTTYTGGCGPGCPNNIR